MAGPVTARPPADASPDERSRWWVDVAFTAGIRRRGWVTWILLAVCVATHVALGLVMATRGKGLLWATFGSRGVRLLGRAGGLTHAALHGEPWRAASSLFLHADALHLALNGLALWGLGELCEALYGPVRFLWLFLLCGLGGSLVSLTGNTEVTVGASGSLFGLMGAAMVFGWRYRRVLPADLGALLRRQLLPWVALNLGIGAVLPFVDNRAHVGGLVTGLFLGSILGNRIVPGAESGPTSRGAMALGSAAILLVAAGGVAGLW